jgi:tetratricopeptide (TPR) repeat protein
MALSVNPSTPSTHVNLGVALFHLGKKDQALEQFSEAAAGYPPSPAAHYWLATGLAEQPGQRAEARREMEEAVRLDPDNAGWRAALDAMPKN